MRDFADWWNVHIGSLDKVDELRSQVGDARLSIQQMVAIVPRGAAGPRSDHRRSRTTRFGFSRPVIGSGAELVEHYGRLAEQGIERVYTWFCDFAPPETLAAFGDEVIAPLRGGAGAPA